MHPWQEISAHLLCMSRNFQCTKLKKEKNWDLYEYKTVENIEQGVGEEKRAKGKRSQDYP